MALELDGRPVVVGFARRFAFIGAVFIAALGTAQIEGGGTALDPFPSVEVARRSGPGQFWQGGVGSVNLYSLANQISLPLINWRSRGGLPMGFTLYSNSMAYHENQSLRGKWRHSYDTELLIGTVDGVRRAAVIWGNHRIQLFERSGSNWVSVDGYRDKLESDGNNFLLTLANQNRVRFELAPPSNSGANHAPRRYRMFALVDRTNIVSLQYDGASRLTRVDDPSGRSLRFTYASGRMTTMAFFVGGSPQRTWTFAYDGAGRLNQVVLPVVTTDSGLQTYLARFTYNAAGNITSSTNTEGQQTTYGYIGNEIAFEQWPGNTSSQRVLFTRSGPFRTVSDPRGNTTTYEYDSLSRLIRTRDAEGFDRFYAFSDTDYAWAASVHTDPSGIYRYDYDTQGRPVRYTDPSGQQWDYAYDASNNLTQALEPLVIDAWGLPQPGRHRTDFSYDANNNLVQRRSYTGPTTFITTQYSYDGAGNMTGIVDPMSHPVEYQYDANGNLTKTTTTLGKTTTYFFDAAALTAGFTVPNAWADANGLRTELIRDEWGRLRAQDFTTQPDQQYRYDGMSRLVRMTDGTGITDYSYNANGWLMREVKGGAFVTNSYYPNGLRSSMLHDSGSGPVAVNYDYNGRNLLRTMNDMGATSQYTYDSAGRLITRQMGNGASSLYAYTNGRLAGVLQRDGTNTPIVQFSYAYQQDGRLAQSTEGGVFTRYGYDYLNRLVREERNAGPAYLHQWAYDSDGLRIQQTKNGQATTYQNDADHLLIQAAPQGFAPEIYQYDANGRMTQRVRNNNAEIFRFFYDTPGRMTRMEIFNPNTSAFDAYRSFQYDGMSRRIRRDVFGANGMPLGQGSYFYEGGDIIRVDKIVQGMPSVEAMTWAGGLSRMQDLAGQETWSATDGRGDMRSSTNDLGQYTGYNAVYNSFGETVLSTGNPTIYQFGADRGIRTEGDAGLLFTTKIDWSGPGDEGPEESITFVYGTVSPFGGLIDDPFFFDLGAELANTSLYDPKIGRTMATGPGIPPAIDSFFDVFTTVELPAVQRGGGYAEWRANFGVGPSAGGDVDGRDFLIWQRSGSPVVDAADYVVWRKSYPYQMELVPHYWFLSVAGPVREPVPMEQISLNFSFGSHGSSNVPTDQFSIN